MDYNLWFSQTGAQTAPVAQAPALKAQVLATYRQALARSRANGNPPLFLGNHFNRWNNSVYSDALTTFVEETCNQPDVRCVSNMELVSWLAKYGVPTGRNQPVLEAQVPVRALPGAAVLDPADDEPLQRGVLRELVQVVGAVGAEGEEDRAVLAVGRLPYGVKRRPNRTMFESCGRLSSRYGSISQDHRFAVFTGYSGKYRGKNSRACAKLSSTASGVSGPVSGMWTPMIHSPGSVPGTGLSAGTWCSRNCSRPSA